MSNKSKLSIIVPVFNEERTVAQLLQKVVDLDLVHDFEKEIIAVNDASKDGSMAAMRQFVSDASQNILLLNHELNQGKGAAIRTGMKAATGNLLVIQDADLELHPTDINLLLDKLVKQNLDVVYGSRFLDKKTARQFSLSFFANKFLTWLTGFLVARKITDMETCYKMVKMDLARSVVLRENRFGFEPEITMKLLRRRTIKFSEVAINYIPRTAEEGKKIGWRDGARALWCLLKYRFFT